MDTTNKELEKDIERLTSEFNRFLSRFERLEGAIKSMYRETGTDEGRSLFQQIDEMERKIMEYDKNIAEMQRDIKASRKLLEYGDVRLKEIMQALSLIYKNTDELEETLIDAESIQTR
ncbi:hypothetical protein GF389_02120 [Candidatus Dojkabacteria bacterium]|nr:hypothetical protein [Candidatus Dojkabacteria bacterium]